MPTELSLNPWTALEALHTGAPLAAWQEHCGQSFSAFQAAFLQATPLRAALVPCPRGCGCVHEVVRHSADDWVGVCQCNPWRCDDLALAQADLVVWTLDWLRFGRAFCQALGLRYRPAEVGLLHTKQLGAWSANAVPAILTLAAQRQDLLFVIARLVARLDQPFILWAPTGENFDAAAKELLAGVGADFFDLASHAEFTTDGSLRPLKPPGELFTRFNPQPQEPLGEQAARQAFALVKALDAERPVRKASLYTVFRLYCLEGLNVAEVARRCRCDPSLVFLRLAALRHKLDSHPRALRQYSTHFEQLEENLSDPRARRVHRQTAAYGEESEEGQQD